MQEYIPTSPASPQTQFKTQDQYLQDILAPRETMTSAPSSAGTPAGTSQAAPPATSYTSSYQGELPTTPQKEYEAPASGQVSAGTYNPQQVQSTYSKLFAPVQTDLSSQYGTLGRVVGGFNTAAGLPPTPQNVQGTIENSLKTGDLAPAQGLVSAKYTGPTSLGDSDQAAMDSLTKGWTSFLAQGRGLDTAEGAKELIRKAVPTLSPGELRAEGSSTWRAPGYQTDAEKVQQEISKFYDDFLRSQGEAQAIGKQRGATAKKTAEESLAYLTGQEESLKGALGNRVSSEKANLEKIKAAYAKAKGGDYKSLWDIPEEYRAGWTPEQVEAGSIDRLQAAQAQREAIMAKYPDLKNIPLMTAGTTKEGRDRLQFPDEWWTQNQGLYQDWAPIKAAARRRQAELEALGQGMTWDQSRLKPQPGESIFKSYMQRHENPKGDTHFSNLDWFQPVSGTASEPGYLDPLYLGQQWTPPSTSSALTLGPDGTIAPETVATADEARRMAAIQQLLGLAPEDAFQEGQDYQAPTIGFDLPAYRSAEAESVEQQKRALQEAISRYLGA